MKLAYRDIHAALGGSEILHGVDLSAPQGKITGIIGPNGSGKSTLVKTTFRIVPLRQGDILLDGRSVRELSPRQLAARVGYVSQESAAVFDFTVREVVEMAMPPRRAAGLPTGRQAVDAALEALGIARLAGRSILSLSGGERKMVFLARAVAQGVDTILLDEPTNHLDISHQLFIMDYLKASGKTVLIVLHDLRLAAHYCDDLCLLERGRVVAAGAPEEVLRAETVERVFHVQGRFVRQADGSPDFLLQMT